MAKSLEEITKQLDTLRSEQMRLESINFQKSLKPKISASIGKTFVYRNNCYSHEAHWDTFRKLLTVEFSEYHAVLIYEECHIPSDGRAKIEIAVEYLRSSDNFPNGRLGWEPCDVYEYDAMRASVEDQFTNPTSCVAYARKD